MQKSPKRFALILVSVVLIDGLFLYGLSSYARSIAGDYLELAAKTSKENEKMVLFEKSNFLIPTEEKALVLADLYSKTKAFDRAQALLSHHNSISVLNKRGELYNQNSQIEEAIKYYQRALNKDKNVLNIEGLFESHLLSANPQKALDAANEMASVDTEKSSCMLMYLNLAEKSPQNNTNCKFKNLSEHLEIIKNSSSDEYIRLLGIKKHLQDGYLLLARNGIKELLNDKPSYRDAHLLASVIYERLGDKAGSDTEKVEASKVDPFSPPS